MTLSLLPTPHLQSVDSLPSKKSPRMNGFIHVHVLSQKMVLLQLLFQLVLKELVGVEQAA